jgi:glycosyl transferase family 1
MPAQTALWVTGVWDDEPRSGGAIRSHRMVEALRAHGIAVEIARAGWSGIAGRAIAAARSWPLSAARAWTPCQARTVRAAQRAGAVVIADNLGSAVVPELTARTIVALQNVESRCMSAPASGVRRRFDRWLEHRGTPQLEARVVGSPAELVVVSERDASLLGRGVVVRNGADVPASAPPPAPGPPLFVGAMDYAPNEDAVRWWAAEIWPRVRTRTPLVVVGRRADAVLGDLRDHPAIRLVGEVHELAPHLAAAAFSVVPLRLGEGTRLKVIEAMAHGRPVLGTHKALEGLGFGERDGVVERDGADRIAAEVDALVGDPARVQHLGALARETARANAWNVVTLPFVDLVRRALASSERRAEPNR